ncbi:hypothetical protein EON65_18500 [archaeon]|nr:MAG: hypothetical protein EON65_18500 [archaeon]
MLSSGDRCMSIFASCLRLPKPSNGTGPTGFIMHGMTMSNFLQTNSWQCMSKTRRIVRFDQQAFKLQADELQDDLLYRNDNRIDLIR